MFRRQSALTIHFTLAVALTISMFLIGSVAKAQQAAETQSAGTQVARSNSTTETKRPAAKETPEAGTVYTAFMGVGLGMSADEVRNNLGTPKDKGITQDYFVFSDAKSAQVYYDDQGKVIAVSMNYVGANREAPSPESVLGEAVQAKPDGSMYKLRRFPEAGYWVAYSRTAGENPITTVTIQKI